MKETYEIDSLVIGAGVVGLAVARALAMSGREVWLLERASEMGSQTSSRNSEVIHAGIYYPKDSLKATLCVRGKALLYAYCAEHHIPCNRCGKLIVATNDDQAETLKDIQHRAKQNHVDDLEWIDRDQLKALEPELNGVAALLSPSTGVIDSHSLMVQLLADFEAAGGQVVYQSDVQPIELQSERMRFKVLGQNTEIMAKQCVNASGLQALDLLKGVQGFPQSLLPKPYFAKGDYFSYRGRVPFRHLIYPVPEPGGLGIHLTLDQAGMAKFGPDVTWLDADKSDDFDYRVDAAKSDKFEAAIRRYWPNIDHTRLVPDYSGIRPKLSGPGEPAVDFKIQGSREHGVKGLVNLFGIESPGLTACLAIAEEVVGMLEG